MRSSTAQTFIIRSFELKSGRVTTKTMEKSVAETFKNGTLLITGSTGFLGKTLMEKILRSCSVKKIGIIVRNKRGLSTQQRVADLYNQTVSILFHSYNLY